MYEIVELKYPYDALEPVISARTVAIHYNNHYKGYLNKLNTLLKNEGYNNEYTKEELVSHIDMFNLNVRDDILYNLGGVLNHELYFNTISPKRNTRPTGSFKEAIDRDFGSFDNFKKEWIRMAKLVVGSGYTFLVVKNKKLEIINTPNQETPYIYGLTPIMTIDLWEHAYYLDYQSSRNMYIENFFEIIDFDIVSKLYEEKTKN